MGRIRRHQRHIHGRRARPSESRRQRRFHRRDVPRGGDYQPVHTEPDAARRGVRWRLSVASATGLLTIVCMIAVLFAGQAPFTMAALAIFGFCAFNATIALIYSARREEIVHRLALDSDSEPRFRLEDHGVDGTP